jgi:hypothetical protein
LSAIWNGYFAMFDHGRMGELLEHAQPDTDKGTYNFRIKLPPPE